VAAVVDPTAPDVDEPLPPEGTTLGSSLLRMGLDTFDDAAARLSTLDGEQAAEARPGQVGPSGSGTYFGSMYEAAPNRPDTKAAPRELSEAAVADSDQRPLWIVVRRGERIGPLSMYELANRVRNGEVKLDDVLQHRVSGQETTAGKHEVLRKAFRARQERETLQAFARAGKPSVPVPPDGAWGAPRAQPRYPLRSPDPEPAPRSLRILWIVLAAVAVFGAAGWFLFGR
jgi:hypothetical protein